MYTYKWDIEMNPEIEFMSKVIPSANNIDKTFWVISMDKSFLIAQKYQRQMYLTFPQKEQFKEE